MNDVKPRPALTAEEWALVERADFHGELIVEENGKAWYPGQLATAAIYLASAGPGGKPLFTRKMLRRLWFSFPSEAGYQESEWTEAEIEEASEVLARLESLLPPEEG
jgi:hypothetical protein